MTDLKHCRAVPEFEGAVSISLHTFLSAFVVAVVTASVPALAATSGTVIEAGEPAALENAVTFSHTSAYAAARKKSIVHYRRGELRGNVVFVDPQGTFIFVKPWDQTSSRRYVYLDRYSKQSRIRDKRKIPLRPQDIVEGERVLIRFIERDSFALANDVYLFD